MKRSFQANIFLVLLAGMIYLNPKICFAQWSTSSLTNTVICVDEQSQDHSVMVTDGAGGAFIAWYDTRNDAGDIYMQHIDVDGVVQWTANGIQITNASSMQARPAMIPDGSGGAIVTWTDARNGNDFNIFAQRVNGSGTSQWTPNGVMICGTAGDQANPTLASDGNGGAFITWGSLDGQFNDIYVQGVNADGGLKGAMTIVASTPERQTEPVIISDGSNGALITWRDSRNEADGISTSDIYAQRLNPSGIAMWTANGVAICNAARQQQNATLTSDGSGGAIITWEDERDVSLSASNIDIYAQRVNANGVVQWATDGIAITTLLDTQFRPSITTDNTGGAIIAWQGFVGQANVIALQRINAAGVKQWMASGVPIGFGGKEKPVVISDGSAGAFVIWEDTRGTGIYGQHVNASGTELWYAGGVPITTAYNNQTGAHIVLDNLGGAIIAWNDNRNILSDIYAQHIKADGTLGGAAVIGNQTITFNAIPEKKFSEGLFTLGAIASSGLQVTYTSSNSSVATIEGTSVVIKGVGTSTITANQAGNENFNAAPPVARPLTVIKGDQFITFNALPSKGLGDAAFALNATASSDLAVSYASSNTAVATVSGNTVTVVGTGTTNITASQAGNVNYNAAANAIQPLVVKTGQTISFVAITDKTLGDPSFALSATSSAGLAVTFSSPSDKVTIAGSQVTIVKAGSVTINADQPGNTTISAAPRATQTFCINPSKPSISVTGIDTESPVLTSSNSSGNQWFKDGIAISEATNATFTVSAAGAYTVVTSVDNCTSVTSDESVLVVTGIEKPEVDIKVFPNPMKDKLTVDVSAIGSAPVSVVMYDMLGQVLHAGTGRGTININVDQYQAGAYILKIQSDKYLITKKLRK